jgi:dTDP-4-dehydrorhamnose reductase
VKILVTGSAGQLGTVLPAALKGHELVGLTRAELDITKLAQVREAVRGHSPALLLNAAAYNHVDAAENDSSSAFRVNALGPRNLALAAEELGLPLVHFSTDYVFDGSSPEPYDEWCIPHPLSVYAKSKLAGEEAVRELCRRHVIVRTAWVYAVSGKNFPLTILDLAQKGEVRVVDDQVGCPTYAPHLAEAVSRLIESGAYGTYHLAGAGSTSWFGLARVLFDRLGVKTPLFPVKTVDFPRPARRPSRVVLTTLQDPEIRLPAWEEGVHAFAAALRSPR